MATRLLRLTLLCAAFPLIAEEMWVELGPARAGSSQGFTALARYASQATHPETALCPSIQINGRKRPMAKRPPTGSFRALVCEAVIPAGTRAARIRNQPLPLPAWTAKPNPLIVVIGDTGCRIKRGGEEAPGSSAPSSNAKWNIQNCASPADWPFQEVSRGAAAVKPDLVIHVGDYLYREQPCQGVKGCPGGPSGDTLETWEADFFTPAKELLLAAPWVFIRGNHEDCGRAGDGWFTLLDPRALRTCETYSEPYPLRTNLGLTLAVLDSNPALDPPCKANDLPCQEIFAAQTATYTKAFRTISSWNLDHAWMVTHRPVWSLKAAPGGGLLVLNAVQEASWSAHRPAGIDMIVAGHTHLFEVMGFDPKTDRPVQLVVGNSGTQLAAAPNYGANISSAQAIGMKDFKSIQDFGFTTVQPAPGGWQVVARDRQGKADISCGIFAGKADCRKEN